jgi:hypothetical protein
MGGEMSVGEGVVEGGSDPFEVCCRTGSNASVKEESGERIRGKRERG